MFKKQRLLVTNKGTKVKGDVRVRNSDPNKNNNKKNLNLKKNRNQSKKLNNETQGARPHTC